MIKSIIIFILFFLLILLHYICNKQKKIIEKQENKCNNESLTKKTGRNYKKCCIPMNKSKVDKINKYLSKNHQKIPKIMHQIWIGPKKIPHKWINTFKKDFRKKFPGWKHYLWTDKNVKKLKLKNQKAYDSEKTYNGKSDILRYELLYKFGGIYIDADSSWLGSLDLGNLIKEANKSGFFIARECGGKYKDFECKDGLASGVVGSSKNNPITKYLVDTMNENYFKCHKTGKAYQTIGPYFVDQTLRGFNITIFPHHYFYPIYWLTKDANNKSIKEIAKKYPKSYMTQHGYTTNNL
jgi:inositol phosphorylceramide mannosyltransferase catalytic subunit